MNGRSRPQHAKEFLDCFAMRRPDKIVARPTAVLYFPPMVTHTEVKTFSATASLIVPQGGDMSLVVCPELDQLGLSRSAVIP
jgi:uncharacterized RmlC-like cupin family protein